MFSSEEPFEPLGARAPVESLVGSDELGEAPFVPGRFGYMVEVPFKE